MNLNITENQIKALPLEERQKLVLDLKSVQPNDKAYPNAVAIIKFITDDKKYKEPVMVKVKALENVPVDGRDIKKDQEVEVYPWQYKALARFFELVKGGAAALALLLLVFFGTPAMGQTLLSSAQYNPVFVAGLNGGTNTSAGGAPGGGTTNLYWQPVIVTNTFTNATVFISNGVPVFTITTNYTYTTNIPGSINCTHSSQVAVRVTVAGSTNGLGVTTNLITVPFYASLDGSTNAYPAFTLQGNANANSNNAITLGTNYTLGAAGYLIMWSFGNMGTNALTNITVQATGKPGLTGL
jgi:hypothetical protein